jgi:hypothetical protein
MRPFIAAVVAAVVLTVAANAQQPTTTNAALRYWTAFAVLQDPPADAATTDLLLRVMDGGATWDEGRLGTILDANADALDIMARASTLRACDWGVEYELGPQAPIPHLAKARVLGRLSVLSGMRLAARGQTSEAVDRWLASVRFAQHLAQGGTVISLLSAQSFLVPSLHALAGEVSRLNPDSRARIEAGVRALPETGFDWPAAMRRDENALAAGVRLKAVANLRTEDLGALRTTVTQIADALSLPPDRARSALAKVNLGSFPLPSPTRINEQRETIRLARQRVVDALAR